MKVSELAREFDKSSDDSLTMLKSLKLKAKGADQELSAAVVSVLESQFAPSPKATAAKPKKIAKPAKSTKKIHRSLSVVGLCGRRNASSLSKRQSFQHHHDRRSPSLGPPSQFL